MTETSQSSVVWRALAGLGITQIIGWGTTYYLLTTLGGPIGAELGLAPGLVAGGMSILMVVSALVGPFTGRLMDVHGAGPVLAAGSLIAAVGHLLLSFAVSLTGFVIAWVVIGMAASMMLYPAAFTALTQIAPNRARRSITILTLPGGLASTIFWPFSAWLLTHMEWRSICQIYAALNVLICLPIHLFAIPPGGTRRTALERPPEVAPLMTSDMRPRAFVLLASVLALNSLLVTGVLNQFTTLLAALGHAGEIVVTCSILFGVSQVAGRILEMIAGGNYNPSKGMVAVVAGFAVAVLCLGVFSPLPAGAIAFAVMFGACNGLFTINRSALILYLFGSAGFGHTNGTVARAQGVTGAAAPIILATIIGQFGGGGAIIFMVSVALLCVLVMLGLWSHARRAAGSR